MEQALSDGNRNHGNDVFTYVNIGLEHEREPNQTEPKRAIRGDLSMRRNLIAMMAAICLYLSGAAMPASAHHAFAAEFDKDKCADFSGTLTNIDWENPHAYFTMDV